MKPLPSPLARSDAGQLLCRLRTAATAASLAILSCIGQVAHAGPYDSLFVFGDSLSDSGNVFAVTDALSPGNGIPVAPYFDGRFSNGRNYADRLAQRLGLSAEAVFRGGTNFAIGGATASQVGPLPTSLVDQRNLFLAASGGVASPNALFVTWIGSNDIQNVLDAAVANPASIAGAGTILEQSVADLRGTILALAGVGARSFLVPTVPFLGLTPKYTAPNPNSVDTVSLGNLLSFAFNTAVDNMLLDIAQQNGSPTITRLDTNAVFLQAMLDPAAFGLTNVTQPCISGDFLAPGSVCADASQYLFWDQTHPTAGVHQLIGDLAFAAVVPVPGSALLFPAGLLVLMAVRRRNRVVS
jgi:phospholipase/lecithinase/hemolysin